MIMAGHEVSEAYGELPVPEDFLQEWGRILIDSAVTVPLLAALIIALLLACKKSGEAWEPWVALCSQAAMFSSFACLALFTGLWLTNGQQVVRLAPLPGGQVAGHGLPTSWQWDYLSASCSLLASLMALGTMRFASTYLHREAGFSRFFMLANIFTGSMLGLLISGDLAFSAWWWELIGFSSVLLVGFYHNRPGPQAAARTVFAYYRIADSGLLLAVAWLMTRGEGSALNHLDALPWSDGQILGLLLMVAVMGKSAQWPLMAWLPRAMEGPTPSSALFYGGMSVHAGAYLVLRTQDLWLVNGPARWIICGVGVITLLAGMAQARSRADAKSALANSTSASLGLVLVVAALGWTILAAWMLVGNAALRWYQMLRVPALAQEMARRRREVGPPLPFRLAWYERIIPPWLANPLTPLGYLAARIEKIAFRLSRGGWASGLAWIAPLAALAAWFCQSRILDTQAWPLGLVLVLAPAWFFVVTRAAGEKINATWRVTLAAAGSAITLACASQAGSSHGPGTSILLISGLAITWIGALEAMGSRRLPGALVATIHGWTGIGMAAAAHRPEVGMELLVTLMPVTLAAALLIGAVKARLGRCKWEDIGGLAIEAPRLEVAWLLVAAAFVGLPPWVTFRASDWAVEEWMEWQFAPALALTVALALLTVGWMRVLLRTLWGEPTGPVEDGPIPDLGIGEWILVLGLLGMAALLPFLNW